ncbi:MAG: cytochrome c3 family protein, partial [Desulfobulbaceae bacterium]|nr:cytochrome c3 family protein [Desulfobulbaceae bacterium]
GKDKSPSFETCLGCHEKIREQLNKTHSHLTDRGGNGCLNCHSPHAGDNKGLLKGGGEAHVCRRCHEETFRRKGASLHQHPDEATCSNCHEVHGSNNLAMLKGDGNEVCSGCHKEQGQFTHPVGAKIIDPRNGQMVTCVSCHYPMGTNFKAQLKRSGQKDLCILCHRAY